MSGYVIYKCRYSKRKLAKLFANNGDWSDDAFCAIWSGSALFANYHFKESPDYNGLNHSMCMHNIWLFMIIWEKDWCVCFWKSQSTDKFNDYNMKDSYLLKKNVENCIKKFYPVQSYCNFCVFQTFIKCEMIIVVKSFLSHNTLVSDVGKTRKISHILLHVNYHLYQDNGYRT